MGEVGPGAGEFGESLKEMGVVYFGQEDVFGHRGRGGYGRGFGGWR